MPIVDGITASLLCNGTPLPEFQSPAATNGSTTVFCESIPEQTFTVSVRGLMPPFDLIVKLVIDGVVVQSYGKHHGLGTNADCSFLGIYLPNEPNRLKPFKFSKIQLSEEDDSHPEEIVKNLGTVALEFYKCQLGMITRRTDWNTPQLASNDKFSERNKKASMIPHTISLGEVTTASVPQSLNTVATLWMDNVPYQRYEWKYRSKGMLKTAGIIPRSVSPIPPPPIREREKKPDKKDIKPSLSNNNNNQETKPERKPRASGSGNLISDVDDDDEVIVVRETKAIKSSIHEPIVIDDDDDDDVEDDDVEDKKAGKRVKHENDDVKSNKRAKISVIDLDDSIGSSSGSTSSGIAVKTESGTTTTNNSSSNTFKSRFIDLT